MNYWEKRQTEMFESGEMLVDRYFSKLEKAFLQTKRELHTIINDFYTRYADENGLTFAKAQIQLDKAEIGELNDFIRLSMQNIGKYNQTVNNMSIKARITRYQGLQVQVDAVLRQLYAIDFQEMAEKTMSQVYQESYYQTWYSIDQYRGFHSSFAQISPLTVQALLEYPFNGADFSTRLWKQKDHLQSVLLESMTTILIQGRHPTTLTDDFARAMKSKKFDAYRLLHTESAYLISQANHAAYREDGVTQYQYLATLDSKTCGICGNLDGKIFDVDKAVVGENMSPMHCLCRCTDAPHYDDELLADDTRAARDPETGKTYEVQADMTYKEWRKKYISGDIVKNRRKSYNNPKMYLEFPDMGNIRGITPEIQSRLEAAVAGMMDEYDIRLSSITIEPAGRGDIFVTGWHNGGMSLVINQNADFGRLLERIPGNYSSGYFAGKSIEDYIAHEMFHVMVYQDCATEFAYRAKFGQIERLFDQLKGVSVYADKSGSGNEALAEAFVRIRNGETVSPIIKVLVESYVGRWKK